MVVNGGTSTIAVTVNGGSWSPGGTVTASIGGNVVDTEPLSGGTATLTVGPFATVGNKSVTIAYLGDADNTPVTTSVTVGVDEATASVTAGTPNPASVPINGGQSNIPVTVTSTAPGDATGSVTASVNGNIVDTETLSGGTATLTVGPFTTLGDKTVTIAYTSDDSNTGSGSTTATVESGSCRRRRQSPATPTPASVVVNAGISTIAVTVAAAGGTPTGTVTATVGNQVVTEPLVAGAASLVVGPFTTVGPQTVTIAYSGDTLHNPASHDDDGHRDGAGAYGDDHHGDGSADDLRHAWIRRRHRDAGRVHWDGDGPQGSHGPGQRHAERGRQRPGRHPGHGARAGQPLAVGHLQRRRHACDVVHHGDPGRQQGVVDHGGHGQPDPCDRRRRPSNITVVVTSSGGTPTGTVQAYVGGNLVDSGTLASGSATLTVGPFATVGDQDGEGPLPG